VTNLEQTRRAWEECAEAYDRALTDADMRAAQRALLLLNVGPGTRLLDIAAGPGALSIPAARLGADVLAVDYSSAMVQLLRLKAAALNLSNLRAQLMDGMALALDDESFDVACSELGIMLFPDRAKGLGEMARVVRPGGSGAMVVLGPPHRVPALSLVFEAMEEVIAGFTVPASSPLFCLQDPDTLRREMQQAGFEDVRVETFESRMHAGSDAQLWENLMAGAPALAGVMKGRSPEERQAVRRAFLDLVRERFGTGPIALPMAFNIGIGTKPIARTASPSHPPRHVG
jgi:ubiquinone/menaquinone biosynthesis C-methylase UbiE